MDTATFSYSKWRARLVLIAAPIAALIAVVITVSSLFAFFQPWRSVPQWQSVVVACLGLWSMLALARLARYRHILRYRYVIAREGVTFESHNHGGFIPWARFTSAEHFVLFGAIRLTAPNEAPPVVLVLHSGRFESSDADERNRLALQLIQSGMGRPPIRKWLW